jgi:hypothetical protein
VWRGKSGAEREQRQLKEKRKEEKETTGKKLKI